MHTDFDEFINHAGFDKDEDAFQELMNFTKRQKLLAFNNLKKCEQKLGRKPHLCRFRLFTPVGNGKKRKKSHIGLKTVRTLAAYAPELQSPPSKDNGSTKLHLGEAD